MATLIRYSQAFATGYIEGAALSRKHKGYSRREAERRRPEMDHEEIDRYVQGVDDGIKRDPFRYNLARDRLAGIGLRVAA